MPDLNRRQFAQPELDRFWGNEVWGGTSTQGRLPKRGFDPYDTDYRLGPDTKRGVVGQGQQVMNFDEPDRPLEVAQGGLVPVDSRVDPTWSRWAWRHGGASRALLESDPDDTHAQGIVAGWKRQPVQTIGPDDEIRTNQGKVQVPGVGTHPGFPASVEEIDPDAVTELREEEDLAFMDPNTGDEEFPWVAQVQGKRYLMEGHHRALAARSRGTGEFPAHVMQADDWDDVERQIGVGPRLR